MKLAITVLFAIWLSAAFGQNKVYDYLVGYGPESFKLYSNADKKAYPIFGQNTNPDRPYVSSACLSPDGKRVAYIKTGMKDFNDRLIVMDINTKHKTTIKSQCKYCNTPIWSPDGKWIAYNTWTEKYKRYYVAVIDAANKQSPKILTDKLSYDFGLKWNWMNNSRSILVGYGDSPLVISVLGKMGKIYKVSEIIKGGKSRRLFLFTPDEEKLLYIEYTNEPGFEPVHPYALFIHDMTTKKDLRLSPKGLDCKYIIVRDDKVFFAAETGYGPPVRGIYSVSFDGKDLKKIIPGGSDLSAKY